MSLLVVRRVAVTLYLYDATGLDDLTARYPAISPSGELFQRS
jgi:hypothetical protein